MNRLLSNEKTDLVVGVSSKYKRLPSNKALDIDTGYDSQPVEQENCITVSKDATTLRLPRICFGELQFLLYQEHSVCWVGTKIDNTTTTLPG